MSFSFVFVEYVYFILLFFFFYCCCFSNFIDRGVKIYIVQETIYIISQGFKYDTNFFFLLKFSYKIIYKIFVLLIFYR